MQQLTPGTTLQNGKYRIEKTLGQGGFGITYYATQTMLQRAVAIKEFFMKDFCERGDDTTQVLTGTESSTATVNRFRAKFVKEACNLAKFNHPNIVRIIDIFDENDTSYYVMEYVPNGSLSSLLKTHGPLPEEQAISLIVPVAYALAYIHSHRMTHLDIKPANIMLDGKNHPVLIDFGLAKQYDATSGNQTSTTPTGISEGYAPTEQYKKEGISEFSPESDVYALAATLFKLLTGKTPPPSVEVLDDGLPIADLQACGVKPTTIALLRRVMESRRKERLNDAMAFANQLTGSTSAPEFDNEATSVQQQPQRPPMPPQQPPMPPQQPPMPPVQNTTSTPQVQPKPKKKKKGLIFLWIFLSLLVAGGIAYGVWYIIDNDVFSSSSAPASVSSDKEKDSDSVDMAKEEPVEEMQADDTEDYKEFYEESDAFYGGTYTGKINGKYDVTAYLYNDNGELSGWYYYNSTMRKYGDVPSTYISLHGYVYGDNTFTATATFNDESFTEQWSGELIGSNGKHIIAEGLCHDGSVLRMEISQ